MWRLSVNIGPCFKVVHGKFTKGQTNMKFNNKLNRVQLSALTLCLATSLGLAFFTGSSTPAIGVMLGVITVGVYVMIVSGKWASINT